MAVKVSDSLRWYIWDTSEFLTCLIKKFGSINLICSDLAQCQTSNRCCQTVDSSLFHYRQASEQCKTGRCSTVCENGLSQKGYAACSSVCSGDATFPRRSGLRNFASCISCSLLNKSGFKSVLKIPDGAAYLESVNPSRSLRCSCVSS